MRYWVGFDVGKAFHWVCVLDEEGEEVLSRRVEATEEDLEAACSEIEASGRGAHGRDRPLGRAGHPPGGGAARARREGLPRAGHRRQQGPRRLPGRGQERRQGRSRHRRPAQAQERFAARGLPQGRDHRRDAGARRPPQGPAPGPDPARGPPPRGPAGGVPGPRGGLWTSRGKARCWR